MLPCPTGCEREAVSSSWFLWPDAVMKTDSFRAVLHSARQSRVRYKVGPVASLNYRARLCPRGHSCPSASSLEMELPSAQAWLGVMPVGESMLDSDICEGKGEEPRIGQGEPRLRCRLHESSANPTGRFRARHVCWRSLTLTEMPRPWQSACAYWPGLSVKSVAPDLDWGSPSAQRPTPHSWCFVLFGKKIHMVWRLCLWPS